MTPEKDALADAIFAAFNDGSWASCQRAAETVRSEIASQLDRRLAERDLAEARGEAMRIRRELGLEDAPPVDDSGAETTSETAQKADVQGVGIVRSCAGAGTPGDPFESGRSDVVSNPSPADAPKVKPGTNPCACTHAPGLHDERGCGHHTFLDFTEITCPCTWDGKTKEKDDVAPRAGNDADSLAGHRVSGKSDVLGDANRADDSKHQEVATPSPDAEEETRDRRIRAIIDRAGEVDGTLVQFTYEGLYQVVGGLVDSLAAAYDLRDGAWAESDDLRQKLNAAESRAEAAETTSEERRERAKAAESRADHFQAALKDTVSKRLHKAALAVHVTRAEAAEKRARELEQLMADATRHINDLDAVAADDAQALAEMTKQRDELYEDVRALQNSGQEFEKSIRESANASRDETTEGAVVRLADERDTNLECVRQLEHLRKEAEADRDAWKARAGKLATALGRLHDQVNVYLHDDNLNAAWMAARMSEASSAIEPPAPAVEKKCPYCAGTRKVACGECRGCEDDGRCVVPADCKACAPTPEAKPDEAAGKQWYGVWAMRDGYAGHWHGTNDGSVDDVQTTLTEAKRICKALNEFARERTDSLGWSYEVRPYADDAQKPGGGE